MRSKTHDSNAARQEAYRARKRAGLVRPKPAMPVLSVAESVAKVVAREIRKFEDVHPEYEYARAGTVKNCYRCGSPKPLDEFYKHPSTADGHFGKCKTCARRDAELNREANLDSIQARDRERAAQRRRAAEHLQL